MKPTKGYYCVIQYCPDLTRLEAANIGVLLFCPERQFLKARTVQGNYRIRRFFGTEGHDWSRIESFKAGFEERVSVEQGNISKLEDLEKFIATRANLIQVSNPRPMKVADPENDLDQLFRELVGGEHRQTKTVGFRKYLLDRFANAGLETKLRKDILVTVPVLQRQIEVPYGFQNGRFNLMQPARFKSVDPIQAVPTACKYAVEGRSLYEHVDPKLGQVQLVVIGEFGARATDSKAVVERILKENQVRLFAASDLDRLIDEIRTTGKDLPERENRGTST